MIDIPITYRKAAVIVPVFRRQDGVLHVALIRRSEGGAHGGQLAFPGGKAIAGDGSMEETALRETEEEVGLARSAVTILEALPVVRTMRTGFEVSPFLARIVPPEAWRIQDSEIAEVIEVEVAELARPEARGQYEVTDSMWPGPPHVPSLAVGAYRLWGMSYRIFEPLILRLLGGEWDL